MRDHHIDAVFITTEADFRYFTGFQTRFWESPTRPWYLIIPAEKPPLAVIPQIGAPLFENQSQWDFRSWVAPDYDDDGVSLLASSFRDLLFSGAKIGVPSSLETHLRMPLQDFDHLKRSLDMAFLGDENIVKKIRAVKSEIEISKISSACQIAERAFSRMDEIAQIGIPLSQVFRDFQRLCLEEGADYVPYLAGAAGKDGYEDVISPANDTPLKSGDILMLDTGLVWDGYFCDFNRNFAIGDVSDDAFHAHQKLLNATQIAFDHIRPGVKISEIFAILHEFISPEVDPKSLGRFGHGLGMQLTEGVSIIPDDATPCVKNMVLTLEPSIAVHSGKIIVHEEDLYVDETGAHWLTNPYKELKIL